MSEWPIEHAWKACARPKGVPWVRIPPSPPFLLQRTTSAFSALEKVRDRENRGVQILAPEQQRAFFDACDDWQRPIFLMPAAYGLRVGELTHPLHFSTAVASFICLAWRAKWCGTRVGKCLASQASPRRCGGRTRRARY